MEKLETFILSSCTALRKFPDIKTNMDNLVELNLERSGIKVVPSSIGRYCTNLVTLDLSYCKHLKRIEGNFHRLQHLEKIYLEGSDKVKIPAEGLFDVKCCLQLLSLRDTSLKKFRQGMVSMKPLGFSTCLRRLNLRDCKLEDGDISSDFFQELSNLQVLDLSWNRFTRLHSSLLRLPRLKYLNLSDCINLVELPDLPSNIAILIAVKCGSLIVRDFPTNLKWLWKVSLSTDNRGWIDGRKLVESMLQGNAVQDYFLSLYYDKFDISTRGFRKETCILELPSNWRNELSGFLIYATTACACASASASIEEDVSIIIEDAMGWENKDDVLKVSGDETTDEAKESNDVHGMCYISFVSLWHTTWWNSIHTKISFSLKRRDFKVELVPRRSNSDLIQRPKDATNSFEFWNEEFQAIKTFAIIHDSKSSIRIGWRHELYWNDMFKFRNI